MPNPLSFPRLHSLRLKAQSAVISTAVAGFEAYRDLLPGVRMTRPPKRIPKNTGAGILGAEVATWWTISPSLLPRPWWVTALNVTFGQSVGHAAGTGTRFVVRRVTDLFGLSQRGQISRRTNEVLHLALGATTVLATLNSLRRQTTQAQLVKSKHNHGYQSAIIGVLVGTAGYGAVLLVVALTRASINKLDHQFRRWLPPLISGPLAVLSVATVTAATSNRMVVRRGLDSAYRRARKINSVLSPSVSAPIEKERSGSPQSYVKWSSVGSKGRDMLCWGPRSQHINEIMGADDALEPIRIFVGLSTDRSTEESAQLTVREMERTGAFERSAIVLMTAAGTGWINAWTAAGPEFLLHGDCAMVTMQYSYLPSGIAYFTDHDSPVESSIALLHAVEQKLSGMPRDQRPRIYVAGESLGAYGMADTFSSETDLVTRTDGALFTGTPHFTRILRKLSDERDVGSPERLPIVGGGRHVRFVSTPAHLHHDCEGKPYAKRWESTRIVFAQHASDPVAFWDWDLFIRQPDWLDEPGSRGVPAPQAQQLDVFDGMRWVPFITGWQVALDQVSSIYQTSGHGHVYTWETLYYWAAILNIHLDEATASAIAAWIRKDIKR